MANTGYGACEDVDATTSTAITNRSTANKNVGGGSTRGQYLSWMTKRKPWVRAYSCASTYVGKTLGDTGKPQNLSDLYHSDNRPKPGITNFNTTEEGTHGGFKEATLKFVCWTKDDFSELAVAFLTYGRTVTVEWGWSVDTSGTTVAAAGFADSRCSLPDPDFYKKIKAHRDSYEACMDVIRGQVTDFSWAIGANGSFECECTLTSMAGNVAAMPAKAATKDCSCPEDAKEDEAEKGPTFNVLQTLESMKEQCMEDEQTLTIGGVVCGVGMNADAADDQSGADESKWPFGLGSATLQLNFITFECFEEYVVNHNIMPITDDAGDDGIDRAKASTVCGTGYGSVANSGNSYEGLFYSNHSVCRGGVTDVVSGDPSVCLIPGSTYTDLTVSSFNKISGDFSGLSAQAPDGIYLGGILLNIQMLEEEFNALGKDDGASTYVKRVLDRVTEACGGFWNFTMVPHPQAESIVQWLDIDKSPQSGVPSVLTIPAYGKDSIARNVSTQTESDPDFRAQITYGANNTNGKGGGNKSGGISLWTEGVTDTFKDSIRVSSECADQDTKENCNPPNEQKNDELDLEKVKDIFKNLGKEISPESTGAGKRSAKSLALGETDPVAEPRVVPLPITLDVELDGIGGFTFGNLITTDYLPSQYDGYCFQITKVEQALDNSDWKTTLACGFMRKTP